MLADAVASAWLWPALAGGGLAALALAVLVLATPVYKHVMCAKYLFGGWKAVVPLVSCLPAALGVFLLILVFAIMDGFAEETREMTRGTLSDIIVDAHMEGLPYYDEFCRRIEAIDGVEAATPIIQTYAVVRVKPTRVPVEPLVRPCVLLGIRPSEKVKMGRFRDYLTRQKARTHAAADLLRVPEAWQGETSGKPRSACIPGKAVVGAPLPVEKPEETTAGVGVRVAAGAGAILMLVVTLFVFRAARRRAGRVGWVLGTIVCALACAVLAALVVLYPVHETEVYRESVEDFPLVNLGDTIVVSTIPVRASGAIAMEPGGLPKVQSRVFTLVDYFRSGFWESDSSHVYVDFDVAQQMAGMAAEGDGSPARANQVHVKIADPARGEALCRAIETAWFNLVSEKGLLRAPRPTVQTWEAHQEMLLTLVKVQRDIVALMLGSMFLGFGVLIALISYVMAFIKSRDVGILKALGARDSGVGSLFLGYGFAVGLIGVAIGLTGSLLVLVYLDQIEIWVNQTLGVDVFSRKMYYFEHIPRNISTAWCVGVSLAVLALSTLASAAGGLLAALKQPVEALRYE